MNFNNIDADYGTTNHDEIDAQAEREAAALEWLANELEIDTGTTLFEVRRAQPVVKNCRYSHLASWRAHGRIEQHYRARLAGKLSTLRTKAEICTKADRARRAQRQERRRLLLQALERERAEWVPFGLALVLVDARPRTLHRATMEGRIAKRVKDRRVFISVAGLRDYLRHKVAA